MSITRKKPASITTRHTALRQAFTQNTAAGVNTVLTGATITRLNTIYGLYDAGINLINVKQGLANGAVAVKDTAQQACALYANHFLSTIMMAVERGEMPVSVLAMYGLALENPKLPPLDSEQQILTAALNCVSGEAARIAAGGTALPMPTIAQVTTRKTDFDTALTSRNAAALALDQAQEAVQTFNVEADKVIGKVWDESETFYNEESDESRRAKCRAWGLVYVSDTRITISVQALQIAGGAAKPIEAATLTLVETGEVADATDNGMINLKTGFTGTATLRIEATGFVPQDFKKDINGANVDMGEVTMVGV